MFEIFKAILDAFGRLLDPAALSRLAKERGKEELGAKLFMLYIAVDRICIDGEALVDAFEQHLSRMTGYLASAKDRWALGGLKCIPGLSGMLQKQRRNLGSLQHALLAVEGELQILDPLAFRKLMVLTRGELPGKERLVRQLFNLAPAEDAERVPILGPTEEDLLRATDELMRDSGFLERLALGGPPGFEDLDDPEAGVVARIQARYRRGPPLSTVWDEADLKLLNDYLVEREPRKQLHVLRAVADDLRKTLDVTFPASEILSLIGSAKFRTRYRELLT